MRSLLTRDKELCGLDCDLLADKLVDDLPYAGVGGFCYAKRHCATKKSRARMIPGIFYSFLVVFF
jgi:hypothetical protein